MEQTLWVPYSHDIQVLGYFLHSYYAQVDVDFPAETQSGKAKCDIKFLIEGHIDLQYFRKRELLQVQWLTSPKNDLIADSVEYMVNGHTADAMVCISNCDKITPGMLMAAMRLNIPAIFVSGGPMPA